MNHDKPTKNTDDVTVHSNTTYECTFSMYTSLLYIL